MNKDDLRGLIRAAIENIAGDEAASNELMELLAHTAVPDAPRCIRITLDALTAHCKDQMR